MTNRIGLIACAAAFSMLAGCATWDRMSGSEKGTVVGAGAGGLVGNAVTGGSALGTVGGAVAGGVIGHEVGERRR